MKEMCRIHEMWQETKEELRKTKEALEKRGGGSEQMQQLNLELRDKLRFTELRLAGSTEEGANLTAALSEERGILAEVKVAMRHSPSFHGHPAACRVWSS